MSGSGTIHRPLPLSPWEENFLNECQVDMIVGIWEAVIIARRHEPLLTKERILASIRHLLTLHLIIVGVPTNMFNYFERWHGTTNDLIQRIDREWAELGHDPYLGDVCWFKATEKGRRYRVRPENLLPLPRLELW